MPSTLQSGVPAPSRTLPSILRAIATVLILAVFGNSIASAAPLNTQRARQLILARGIGKDINIKQIDGIKITGIITGIRADDFDVTPQGTLQPIAVPYAQVAELHTITGGSLARSAGHGLFAVSIGAAILFVIILIAALAAR